MKTTLLSFILVISVSIVFSQSKFTKITGPYKDLKVKEVTIHPGYSGPLNGQAIGQTKDFSVIGTTWNDLQTLNYGNVMQRMWAYPDGTVGSSWLCAGENNIPERGAGYNYHDGAAWGVPNLHVGPEDRMGSPCYAPWGMEGEIIALYRYSAGEGPIYFYKREVKGEGDWEEVELLPPADVSIVWHSMITSGENNEHIHLLAETYDAEYNGQANALLYYRSSDGGDSWDIYEETIEGLGIDYFATINHLSYAWANPVGNTIAFTYGFDEFGGRVFKSYDNGDNWEIIPVFESPFSSTDPPLNADMFPCGVGTSACALDSEGNVHVAFPRMRKIIEDGTTSWFPYTDGLIYWKEGMDPLDTTIISSTTLDYLDEAGNLIGWVIGGDTWEVPGDQPHYANALCGFPQFSIDDNNNMFVAYSSVVPGYNNGNWTYRHVIVNSSWDGGTTWQGQKDLNTDLIFIFSECAFPMMAPVIQDKVHVTYMEDPEPGISEWLANHDPIENEIHHMEFPKDFFVGTNENHVETGTQMSACYPNPASGFTMFSLNIQSRSEVTVNVLNVIGQLVKEFPAVEMNKGNHPVNVDVSDLSPGVYYCSVEVDEQRLTQKLIVQ